MKRTPSDVGIVIQRPTLPVGWWYDLQFGDVVLLVGQSDELN